MAQIRWSLTASTDLQEIEDFIARDSVLHAVNFVDHIIESAEILLIKNPHIGRIVPEFSRPDLRELIFRRYRIVYLSKDDTITILRVVHGAREILRNLSVVSPGKSVIRGKPATAPSPVRFLSRPLISIVPGSGLLPVRVIPIRSDGRGEGEIRFAEVGTAQRHIRFRCETLMSMKGSTAWALRKTGCVGIRSFECCTRSRR